MANTIKGRIEKVYRDEKTDEPWAIKVGELTLKYSIPENRKLPWDAHTKGNIVEVTYNPQERNGKIVNWVSTISRLDEDTNGDEPAEYDTEEPFLDKHETPEVKAQNAAKVKEVVDAEHYRDDAISRQVAMKATAEVVVALIAAGELKGDADGTVVDVTDAIKEIMAAFDA